MHLKGAATGAATIAVATPAANAQSATGASAARHSAPAPAPSPEQLARDAGSAVPPPLPAHTTKRPGSISWSRRLKELEWNCRGEPRLELQGLQESLLNYGDPPNSMPELISRCTRKPPSTWPTAMARPKAARCAPCCTAHRPAAWLMAICSLLCGHPVAADRRPRRRFHFRLKPRTTSGAIVRSLPSGMRSRHSCRSAWMRCRGRWTMPSPTGPTLVIVDTELQKQEAALSSWPPDNRRRRCRDRRARSRRLLGATNPHINVGQYIPEGVRNVSLSELVATCHAARRATSAGVSFPQRHPLQPIGTRYNSHWASRPVRPVSQSSAHGSPRSRQPVTRRAWIGRGAGRARDARRGARRTGADDQWRRCGAGLAAEIVRRSRGLMTPGGIDEHAIAARTAKHAAAESRVHARRLRPARPMIPSPTARDASSVTAARSMPSVAADDERGLVLSAIRVPSRSHIESSRRRAAGALYSASRAEGGMGYGAGACRRCGAQLTATQSLCHQCAD